MGSSMAEKSRESKADDDGKGGSQDANMSTNGSDVEDGEKPNDTGLQARDGASVGAVADGNVPGAKGKWSNGSPVKGAGNKSYGKPEAAFKDMSSPTFEELANFDRTRSFFMLKKDRNVENIINIASFEEVNKSDAFFRLKPVGGWKLLESHPNIHMTYIGVAEDVSTEGAKMLMEIFAKRISLPHNSPPLFQGVDIEGQINTSSRNHIETVVYFSHKPNLDDLSKFIIKLVKGNEKLLAILGCENHVVVRSQLQLTNCVGVATVSLIDGISSRWVHASNPILMPDSHIAERIQQSEIYTSGNVRITISHLDNAVIPTSFEVPTLAGGTKIIQVKRMFQYEKRRRAPAASFEPPAEPEATDPESHPLYRTRLCKKLPECPYKDKCWFAHEKVQLRTKPTGSSKASDSSSSEAPNQSQNIATAPSSVFENSAKNNFSPSEASTQSGNIATEQRSLAISFTRTEAVPPVLDNVSQEDPFTVSINGKTAPCGQPRFLGTTDPIVVSKAATVSGNHLPVLNTPQPARVPPVMQNHLPTSSAQFPQQQLRDGETNTPMSRKTKNSDRSPHNISPNETLRKPKEQRSQLPAQSLATNAAAAAAIAAIFTHKPFGTSDVPGVAKRGGNRSSNNINAPHQVRNNNRQLPIAPSFGATGPKKF